MAEIHSAFESGLPESDIQPQEPLVLLNGLYLLCSRAQYPVQLSGSRQLILLDVFIRGMWPAVGVSDSAAGTLIELWLTRCHGNAYSPTVGQKCFYLPRATQTVRAKCPACRSTGSAPAVFVYFNFLCHGKEHKHG